MLYRYCFPKQLGLDSIFTSRDLINRIPRENLRFLKKLGLDTGFGSWDLKNRIPREILRIQSYSQVDRSKSRSKYLKIYFLIGFCSRPVFLLIGSLG